MKKSATKSSPRAERGLHELYREDPERADRLLFGRQANASRRGFLKGAGIAGMGAALGLPIVFADKMPGGLIPAAYADSTTPFNLKAYGKSGLVVLNDRPINAETPPHLLDDSVTPAEHMFVRNNGIPPVEKDIDPKEWKLRIGGESAQATRYFTIDDLKSHFKHYTYHLQIECGGNGRAEYDPPAKGNQWTTGAVSCANWTGRALARCSERGRHRLRRDLHGLLRGGFASERRPEQKRDFARRADEKSDGRRIAHRLGRQRRGY